MTRGLAVLLFVLFFWVAPVFVGHKSGEPKNRTGWAWGLLLGWLGVIILACLGPGDGAEHKSFRLSSTPSPGPPSMPPPSIPPPQMPPAGWYADPTVPGRVRYWDGAAWTTYSAAPDAPHATTPTP